MFSSQIDGGDFSFSQSQPPSFQNNDQASSAATKVRGVSTTMPLTVKQINDALQAGDARAGLVVDGVEATNIRLVGMVNGKVERVTDVAFTLDDGTGRLSFIRWLNDASDTKEMAVIQNGMYVAVTGSLKGFQEKNRATAFSVRPVVDYNEIAYHFLHCIRMHLEHNKSKVPSSTPVKANSSSVISASIAAKEQQFPTSNLASSVKTEGGPANTGTNGLESDIYKQVLNVLEEINNEHGVHIDEVVRMLRLPENKIKDAIEFLAAEGRIYSTIDDYHYKSTFCD